VIVLTALTLSLRNAVVAGNRARSSARCGALTLSTELVNAIIDTLATRATIGKEPRGTAGAGKV